MPDRKLTVAAAIATTLASLALYPIFNGSLWFWSSTMAVIVVGAAGMLTRIRRLPPLVCLAGGVAGLLLYLNVRFEAPHSLAFLIPTPGSLDALVHLTGQGLDSVNSYAPPVPQVPAMVVLASAGVGIVAIFVDFIAVRLGSAAVAGLPLLMLFTEPFAVSVHRSGIGTGMVFCLAAAGYLGLLSADGRQRIRAWGRLAGPVNFTPDTTALATAGRRVGLASVVLALIIPLLMPGLHATRLFAGAWTFGGSGDGGGSVTLPSPVTQLSKQLTETRQVVLTYTTTNPDAATQYLQEYVLGDLTDSGWTWAQSIPTQPVGQRLPSAVGLISGKTAASTVSTTIKFSSALSSSSEASFLPLPYPPVTLKAAGTWSVDPQSLMVLARNVNLAGFSYKVTSLNLEPSSKELETAVAAPRNIAADYETVPASYHSLLSLAEKITRGDKTELDKALALQSYLSTTGGFTYTLSAPSVTTAASLTTFLEYTKHGYCEQFAYAMTVLSRLLGIPARYAIGYTAGERQSNGSWVVRTSDAHAWPELYFSGVGWIRFEPTPAGSGGQGTATAPAYAALPAFPGGPAAAPTTTPTSSATAPASGSNSHDTGSRLHALPAGDAGSGGGAGSRLAPGDPWIIGILVGAALILLVLVLPGLARVTARSLRWRSVTRAEAVTGDTGAAAMATADTAWRQFRVDLADHHIASRPSESPRAIAARVAAELAVSAAAAEAMRRIAMAAERARYSAAPAPSAGLRADTVVARQAIRAAVSRRTRLEAWLLPMSVLGPATARASRFLDFGARVGRWRPRTTAG